MRPEFANFTSVNKIIKANRRYLHDNCENKNACYIIFKNETDLFVLIPVFVGT